LDYPASPFSTSAFRIQVFTEDPPSKVWVDGDTLHTERSPRPPIRDDQHTLISRIVSWLPDLIPQISRRLADYENDLAAPKVFRTELAEPSICLFSPEENPSRSWSFTVERPSLGFAFGYHLEFIENQYQRIWAGD
jgi:hypothetical protein